MKNILKENIFIVFTVVLLVLLSFSASNALDRVQSDNYIAMYNMPDRYAGDEERTVYRCTSQHLKDGTFVWCLISDIAWVRTRAWVSRIDNDGNTLWEKELGKEAEDAYFNKTLKIDDESIIFVGVIGKETPGLPFRSPAAWILRLNMLDGTVVWEEWFRYSLRTQVTDIIKTADGIVVVGPICGCTNLSPGERAGFIAEYDLDGKRLWMTHQREEHRFQYVSANDGGFLVSGEGWETYFDGKGELVWDRQTGNWNPIEY